MHGCAGTLTTTWDNTGDTGADSGNSSSLLPFYTSGVNALFAIVNGVYQPVINMDVSDAAATAPILRLIVAACALQVECKSIPSHSAWKLRIRVFLSLAGLQCCSLLGCVLKHSSLLLCCATPGFSAVLCRAGVHCCAVLKSRAILQAGKVYRWILVEAATMKWMHLAFDQPGCVMGLYSRDANYLTQIPRLTDNLVFSAANR